MKNILIVVDYQNDFISPKGQVAKKIGNDLLLKSQKLADKLQSLLDKWHDEDKLVLFLVSDYSLDNYKESYRKGREKNPYGNVARKGTWGHELYQLKTNPKDIFIVKNYFDGFYKSKLERYLKDNNIEKVYLCGINTDVCVFHTAIGAIIRGYETYVIEDATETTSPNKQIFLDYLDKHVGIHIIKSGKI